MKLFVISWKPSNKVKLVLRMQNFLKVDLSSDTLSDKLAFLEANPSANIKRTLDGEELTATETAIFEYFDNTELQIIILSSYHLLPPLYLQKVYK
ncbi:unnamed protein product [Rhizophagus irregularis]|nr:unnamed protein product [Rhizophagus irregularis]